MELRIKSWPIDSVNMSSLIFVDNRSSLDESRRNMSKLIFHP
jgi:hypothetical protein